MTIRNVNREPSPAAATKNGHGADAFRRRDPHPEMEGVGRVLITADRLQHRVEDLGRDITRDFAGKQLALVGVLNGVACFMSDLMRAIALPVSVDFMAVHHDGTPAGMRVTKELDHDITGRHVLVVEDILDTGITLNWLLPHLQKKSPASLSVCALLDKPAQRIVVVPADYVGFEIPNEFVIGYGLDYKGQYRNLPFIGTLKLPSER